MILPTGFWPGQAALAIDSLTTATLKRALLSVSWKVRPFTGMRKLSKKPGLTSTTGTDGSSSMRGLLRSVSMNAMLPMAVIPGGEVLRATSSTPGIARARKVIPWMNLDWFPK